MRINENFFPCYFKLALHSLPIFWLLFPCLSLAHNSKAFLNNQQKKPLYSLLSFTQKIKSISIQAQQGYLSLQNGQQLKVSSTCLKKTQMSLKSQHLKLSLSPSPLTNCSFIIPKHVDVTLELIHGQIDFKNLHNNIFSTVTNGLINFQSNAPNLFKKHLSVKRGSIENLTSPQTQLKKTDFKLKAQIENGQIRIHY